MKPEKLSMCRICLVQNVRMYVVVNKSLQELYEKLTDVPFVTEDRRPMLACFFCCAKIKQCAQFQRRCVQAEQLFTQMLREEWEPKPAVNDGCLKYCGGFTKTIVEHLSIGECSMENITVKEEPPDVCEKYNNGIEEEHHIEEIDLKPTHIAYPDENDTTQEHSKSQYILPHNCESDSEDDVPLTQIKIEVEEQNEKVHMEERRAIESEVVNVKIPKLEILRTRLVDINTDRPKKNGLSDTETDHIRTCTCKPDIKEPFKCNQRTLNGISDKQNDESSEKCTKCGEICQCSSDNTSNSKHANKKFWTCDICQRILSRSSDLKRHIRTHTGEKPFKCKMCPSCFTHKGDLTKHIRTHTGEKPCKCQICQRSFSQSSHLKRHVSQVHSNKRPFKCDICQRSYSDKGSLQRHSRIHKSNAPSRLKTKRGARKCESEDGEFVSLAS